VRPAGGKRARAAHDAATDAAGEVRSCDVVLLASNLSEESAAQLKHAAKALPRCTLTRAWSAAVTHVITEPTVFEGKQLASRTLKHLCGILAGQWIVSSAWVRASVDAGAWVAEPPYELDGDLATNGRRGPSRGRAMRAAGAPLIFAGLHVYLHGKFAHPNPARPQLAELLVLGGASPCASFSALQNEAIRARGGASALAMCDADECAADFLRKCVQLRIPVVSPKWLMDSISHVQCLDLSAPHSEYRLDGDGASDAR